MISLNARKLNRPLMRAMLVAALLAMIFVCSAGVSHAASMVNSPGRVTGVSAKAAGDTEVTVKWKKVKGAKGYAVYCDGGLVERVKGAKTRSYVVTGLDSGTKYSFYVRAYKTYKVKKWLNTKTGKYQTKKPVKEYRGGSKKVTAYKYGKKSVSVKAKTTGVKPVGKRSAESLDAQTIQTEMLRQINEQRAAYGLAALQTEPYLNAIAMEKAVDMYNNGYFDHFSPTWGEPPDQYALHNVSGWSGENIAWGQTTICEVMEDWMNSSGHRANILRSGITHVGMAYYGGFWVQQFSRNPVDLNSVSSEAATDAGN